MTDERFSLPHQVARTGARLTYELEDVQTALAANGNLLIYDSAKRLWLTRNLVLADLPAVALNDLSDVVIVAGATGEVLRYNGTNWVDDRVALDDLSDVVITAGATGEVLRHNGTNWVDDRVLLDDLSDVVITTPATTQHLRYNGTNWVNAAPLLDDPSDVVLSAPAAGQVLKWNGSNWVNAGITVSSGAILTDKTLTATGTFQDWGSAITITNPGVPVSVIAQVMGYCADFTAISTHEVQIGISFDGGSSYTFGPSTREVSGQGGSNYNSQNHAAGHVRAGTPSGNVLIKAQVASTTTTTTATHGIILYTLTATG